MVREKGWGWKGVALSRSQCQRSAPRRYERFESRAGNRRQPQATAGSRWQPLVAISGGNR